MNIDTQYENLKKKKKKTYFKFAEQIEIIS